MTADLYKYVELGAVAVIAVGLLGIVRSVLARMLTQQAAREIAQRQADQEWKAGMVSTQAKIAETLENHLGGIAANQARTAESLELITGRLLDAALETKGRPRASPKRR